MPYQAELATLGTQEGLKATAAEAADPSGSSPSRSGALASEGSGTVVRTRRRSRIPTMPRSAITRATRLWFARSCGGDAVVALHGTSLEVPA